MMPIHRFPPSRKSYIWTLACDRAGPDCLTNPQALLPLIHHDEPRACWTVQVSFNSLLLSPQCFVRFDPCATFCLNFKSCTFAQPPNFVFADEHPAAATSPATLLCTSLFSSWSPSSLLARALSLLGLIRLLFLLSSSAALSIFAFQEASLLRPCL